MNQRGPSFSHPKISQVTLDVDRSQYSWILERYLETGGLVLARYWLTLRCLLTSSAMHTVPWLVSLVHRWSARLNHPEWSPFCHLLILSLGPFSQASWKKPIIWSWRTPRFGPSALTSIRLEHGGTLPIYLSINLSIYLSIYLHIYLSINQSLRPCIHESMHPMHPCIHASMHPCIHASLHPWVHASLHPCIHASMPPSIHVCLV